MRPGASISRHTKAATSNGAVQPCPHAAQREVEPSRPAGRAGHRASTAPRPRLGEAVGATGAARRGCRARRAGAAAPRSGVGLVVHRAQVAADGSRNRTRDASPHRRPRPPRAPRPAGAPGRRRSSSSGSPQAGQVGDALGQRAPNSRASAARAAPRRAGRAAQRRQLLGGAVRAAPAASRRDARVERGRPRRCSQQRRAARRRPTGRRATGYSGSVKVGSVGSVTASSRSQPSFSSLSVWIATALALASRSGSAWNSDDPAAVDLVGDRELAGLVVDLEDDVLAEVLQRRPPRPARRRSSRPCWPTARTRGRG